MTKQPSPYSPEFLSLQECINNIPSLTTLIPNPISLEESNFSLHVSQKFLFRQERSVLAEVSSMDSPMPNNGVTLLTFTQSDCFLSLSASFPKICKSSCSLRLTYTCLEFG